MGEHLDLINGTPWCYVIGGGADSKDWNMDVAQRNRASADLVSSSGQVIIKEKAPQIFRMHAERHACRVGIPGHEVDHWLPLAHQIAVHHHRPDEIV